SPPPPPGKASVRSLRRQVSGVGRFGKRPRRLPIYETLHDRPGPSEFVALALNYHGHEVTEARSGRIITDPPQDAPAAAACDVLIITDISMPAPGGLYTIAAARKAHPTGKIIAMSGGGRGEHGMGLNYLRQARLLGADATLNKPVSTVDLFRTVE